MSEIAFTFSKHGKPVETPQKGVYYVATVPPGTDKAAAALELRKNHPGCFFVIRHESKSAAPETDNQK